MRRKKDLYRILLIFVLWFAASGDTRAQDPIVGYVLTHEHPTAGMAFGGNYAFAGGTDNYVEGIMEKGYDGECTGCRTLQRCDHGHVKGMIPALAMGQDMGLHSPFAGPKHKSFSHLRYSTDWTREAFLPRDAALRDSRMRIMVAFAVEAEAMCEQLFYDNEGKGGAGDDSDGEDGFPCSTGDSFDSMKRQLDGIRAWVDRNSDWMEIALSPADVRRIVAAEKLAIILGIESEYSFGSEASEFDPVERLNAYYDLGVRTFYLAHKINSRLAGADIFLPPGNLAGKALRATQALVGCFYYDDNVGHFPLKGRLGERFCKNEGRCGPNAFLGGSVLNACNYKLSDISEVYMTKYAVKYGNGLFDGFDLYPLPPGFGTDAVNFAEANTAGSVTDAHKIQRNNLGLSHDGERVIREAMLKGMIVNLDHVSSKARKHIHHLATQVFDNYPLNALHNKPNERLTNGNGFKRHEYDFDREELNFVRDTGGFFGVRMGPTDSLEYPRSGIQTNCPKTSTETAKMLAWLIDHGLNVGYSLDFATVTEGVHSRTLAGCGLALGPDALHRYDGFVAEGLTHIGMMRNWHQELETIGLESRYLNELKRDGAEQFVQMWERSEAVASSGAQIPRRIFSDNPQPVCQEDEDCENGFFCNNRLFAANRCLPDGSTQLGQSCDKNKECETGKCQGTGSKRQCVCSDDADCGTDQYCNHRAAQNRCLDLGTSLLGESCIKNAECQSDKCQGTGANRQCVCSGDGDCPDGQFCNNRLAQNRCLVLGTSTLGESCNKNTECRSGKCQGTGSSRQCVCNVDSDCPSGQYCNNRLAQNRCLADPGTKTMGQRCDKNSECSTGKCQGSGSARVCVCSDDSDCPGSDVCKKPAGRRNYCGALSSGLGLGQLCSNNSQCLSGKCQGTGDNRTCVCDVDSDCPSGRYCNNRAAKNRCLADSSKAIGQPCTKNGECATGKCQGTGSNRTCVCADDNDCPDGRCKKPAGRKNYCKR